MTAAEFYPQLKSLHMALVACSGVLFLLRGAAVLGGQSWPLTRAVRVGSVAVDTLLLAAGVALWSVLSLHPLRDAWLGTKMLLLLLYIALGSLALKRARSPRGRALAFVASLACFAGMISVALAHHPLGALRPWLG